MWMSDVLVVVSRDNPDGNGVRDIADALADAGGVVTDVDLAHGVLAATLPAGVVATVWRMEGVAYVRPALTYFRALG